MSSALGGVPGASLIELRRLKLAVGAGRRMAEGADALGNRVHRVPQFGVLHHEHRVQCVEHLPGDIPMKVVRRQVEGVGVREQAAQACGDFRALLLADADVVRC
jgi:hypothetical protein